jgi:endonuclease I
MWNKFNDSKTLKAKYNRVKGLCDLEAKSALQSLVRNASSVSYKSAKKKMFATVDHHNGKVCSVYSKECLNTNRVPNHRVMNAEHTWPKSKGAKKKPAVSDLHHLFPCNSKVNSIRSSYPFCEVRDVKWTNNMSTLGTDRSGTICFEPPKEHKGNVARAMLYFSVRYNMKIDSKQEAWFKKWHKEDPVDQAEIDRNKAISRIQRNSNPFIDQPELVDFISNF